MVWINFSYFAFISLAFWLIGIVLSNFKNKKYSALLFLILGLFTLSYFIYDLWTILERPPMRTLGETRLWYSVFLPVIGILVYARWNYKWFISYTFGLAAVFLIINLLHPESYDKTLMPALRSIWFVPHVIVYMIAYAMLAASSAVAFQSIISLYFLKKKMQIMALADNLVYIGFAFLTMGLLFGALWAKEAWGHYWTWDPKETWALLTWLVYLVYIHLRTYKTVNEKTAIWVLSFAFLILLICWFGVNYLPSASNSVHTYSQT
ncbi:MAG: cytochrome c biogenesis protein CcsA [Bacteroidales bacterium]|nr:cytochrome c biogenesis protein CcsA [Bacteroidales bacterium]